MVRIQNPDVKIKTLFILYPERLLLSPIANVQINLNMMCINELMKIKYDNNGLLECSVTLPGIFERWYF